MEEHHEFRTLALSLVSSSHSNVHYWHNAQGVLGLRSPELTVK